MLAGEEPFEQTEESFGAGYARYQKSACGVRPFAGHVGQHKAQVILVEEEKGVKVVAYLFGRGHEGSLSFGFCMSRGAIAAVFSCRTQFSPSFLKVSNKPRGRINTLKYSSPPGFFLFLYG